MIRQRTGARLRRNLVATKRLRAAGAPIWDARPNAAHEAGGPPVLTVVVTSFDDARYLARCLDSVLAAEWPAGELGPRELIVVDDASSDGSDELARRQLEAAPLPALLVSKRYNTGPADARNLGFELARAARVFVLDADNWIEPGCLARLQRALSTTGPRCAAAYGAIRCVDDAAGEDRGRLSSGAWDVARLVENPYLDAMALYRRRAVLAVGGFPVELVDGWEDYALWLALAEAGHDALAVPDVVASYRVRAGGSVNARAIEHPLRLWHTFHRRFGGLARRYPPAGPACFGLPRSRLLLLAMTARGALERLVEAK